MTARVAPRVDQSIEAGTDRALQLGVIDRSREPALRSVLEDRAPDREAATGAARARIAEAARERVELGAKPEQHDAAAMRIALGDERIDRFPLRRAHRLELPPLRITAEVVEPLQRAVHGVGLARQRFRRNDLEEELVAARLHGVVERADLRLLLQAIVDRAVRMVLHEALDDVLARPLDQRRADRAAAIEDDRIRPRQFHRPADPPAAAGRRVQRILAIAIVAENADAAAQAARFFRLRDRIDEESLEPRDPGLAGAGFLREREELIAVIEREDEELVARRSRRGDAMQARQRRVLVGARNRRRVGDLIGEPGIAEVSTRVGIAGAQPCRETTSAPHALA